MVQLVSTFFTGRCSTNSLVIVEQIALPGHCWLNSHLNRPFTLHVPHPISIWLWFYLSKDFSHFHVLKLDVLCMQFSKAHLLASHNYSKVRPMDNRIDNIRPIVDCARHWTILYWSTKSFEAWLYLLYQYVVLEKRVSGIYLHLL